MHERGAGVPASQELASSYVLKQSAEKNVRSGQARWGLALLEGRGISRNPVEGESWLRRAANAGDREAAALVGDILRPRRRLAAQLRGSRHLVQPRGRSRPRRISQGVGPAIPHRRWRAP